MIQGSIPHKTFNFPSGEMHVVLNFSDDVYGDKVHINWYFERTDEVVELLLYHNAVVEAGYKVDMLNIPYFPFSRQDRVATHGDAFSLKVICDLINSLNIERVITYDAHSDVLPALVKNLCNFKQADIFYPMINHWNIPVVLVSPDGGSLKKIYQLASQLNITPEVVECSKSRNPKTGEITKTVVHSEPGFLTNKVCVIVDDICDGGRTFIEIAKAIRRYDAPEKVVLMVTHGLFTKGLQVFDGLIDEIYTRKGRHVVSNILSKLERRAV